MRGGGVKRDSYVYTAYLSKSAKYVRIISFEFLNSYEFAELVVFLDCEKLGYVAPTRVNIDL